MRRMTITARRLREVLIYNPDNGEWRWRLTLRNGIQQGAIAGSLSGDGYKRITIELVEYRAARLAFLYMNGRWPKFEADHWDRNTSNDRWANLRDATTSQNQANSRKHSDSTSPFKGTTQHSKLEGRAKPHKARIQVNGKRIFLGYFHTPEAASAAYGTAARKHFGEFARVN